MASRERIKERQKKKNQKNNLVVGGVVLGLVAIIGIFAWRELKPVPWSEVEVTRADHIPDGEPIESPTDPPTSGSHYGAPLEAGFYTEESPEYLSGDYDGYIVHGHEHGYVTFWYNCDLIDEASCDQLISDIQDVMDEFNGFKLVAFPRSSLTVPLVMTAWSQIQEFETFDGRQAEQFIRTNRLLAPEPNAP